jgi:predicted permease
VKPPRLARALILHASTADESGLSVVGDLDEEFAQRCARHGARAARRWYWRAASSVWWHAAWRHPSASHHHPRGGRVFDLAGDLRQAWRVARKSPGQATLIVATLSLAIGITTIGFAFADTVFVRGLPIAEPDDTVILYAVNARDAVDGRYDRRYGVYFSDYLAFRDRVRSIERLSTWTQTRATLRRTGGEPVAVTVSRVTGDLFAVWGFRTQLGRGLRAGDDERGRARVAVLSDRHWRELFDASPAAIGETIMISGVAHEIVGVLTPDVEFATFANIALWAAQPVERSATQDLTAVMATGRLADGVTLEQAAAEMRAVAATLAAEHPETHRGRDVLTLRAGRAMGGPNIILVMTLLIGAASLVMIVASVNVAGVLLARSVARQREFGLRMALGAGQGRVFRQLMAEGALLAALSAAGGLAAAHLGLRLIHSVEAELVLRQIVVDWHELLFIAALALSTPVLVSLAPALVARRLDLASILNTGSARSSTGHPRARQALVVAQLALAVMLTIVGSLVARTAVALMTAPIGFDTSHLSTFVLSIDHQQTGDAAQRRTTLRDVARRIEAQGQLAVGALDAYPTVTVELPVPVAVAGVALRVEDPSATALVIGADEHGLSTLGVPVVAGRGLTASDVESDAPVALISVEAARRHFGGPHGAIGRHLAVGVGAGRRERQIVGVTGDVRDIERQVPARVWVPLAAPARVSFVVRGSVELARTAAAVRMAARAAVPDVPVESLEPYQAAIDRRTGSDRVMMGMLIAFAAVALIFAATGLYGIVAMSVTMRRAEFGTRVALGAQVRDVAALVLGQAFKLLGAGVVFGVAGGVAAGTAMRRLLFGISPLDPINMLMVAVLVTLVTLAASVGPAIRAMRLDVVQTLRSA